MLLVAGQGGLGGPLYAVESSGLSFRDAELMQKR
jgi:hypothetical protein